MGYGIDNGRDWVSAVAFDLDDLKKLFNGIDDPKLSMACLIAFFTGMRIGEVCQLTKSQFDIKDKLIRLKHGKTGPRDIEIVSDEFLEILKKWFEYIPDNEYIIPTRNLRQKKMAPKSLAKAFRIALKKLGLDYQLKKDKNGKILYKYSFHSFRHSYTTVCAEFGIPPEVTQKQLGHKSIRTTYDVYTHLSRNKKRKELTNVWNPKENLTKRAESVVNGGSYDALSILDKRLAVGEITPKEYDKIYNTLMKKTGV